MRRDLESKSAMLIEPDRIEQGRVEQGRVG